MLQKYTPSGTFSSRFFVGAPLVLLGAAVLGAVYQVAIHYVPYIKADLLIVMLMCVATIFLVRMLTKTAHCRNRLLAAGLGLAAGGVAVGVSHVVQYRMDRPGLIAMVPAEHRAVVDANFGILDYLAFRADAGWAFSHGGSNTNSSADISGAGVYICWAIEAAIIMTAATIGGVRAASAPYCEPCETWADYDMLKVEVPEPSAELVANIKGALTLDSLFPPTSTVSTGAAGAGSLVRYSVLSCPTCKMTHTVMVEHERMVTSGKKTEKKKAVLQKGVVLTSVEVGRLAELKGRQLS